MPSTLVPVFVSGCAEATQDRGDRASIASILAGPRWRASEAMPKLASRRQIAQCIAMIGAKTGQWWFGGLSAPLE